MKIDFRGKDIKAGEWRYGVPILNSYGEKSFICIATSDNFTFPLDVLGRLCHEVDSETVGQYTNLNDKNGKKIFDGDRCWNDYEEEYGIVSFDEGKFIFTFDNVCVDLFEVADDLEVVGTIHDLEVSE
ncbi:hypothetical protein C1I14_03695 [Listeria monocytogenes]|uniref:YopX family protein n=1 Tax=Listeria monocytogenes TaxID=1639 RepID=UPI00086D950C|nr:YopX family protein [Listeria monocytogenes]EAG6272505.1 hypothetical protein [Listeria monocytogenes CFSAN003726]EAG6360628.1 hypothetical protein [Listeria monocytogenes CFSAN003729]EAG6369632.1 hypothetical protein [Listeria monocytogenes CFSAN003728]EAC3320302.1 hypothetical protein [Listeria monocytogenes]EAC3726766.1 hypothetical protein [Listeria monocytogenes]